MKIVTVKAFLTLIGAFYLLISALILIAGIFIYYDDTTNDRKDICTLSSRHIISYSAQVLFIPARSTVCFLTWQFK